MRYISLASHKAVSTFFSPDASNSLVLLAGIYRQQQQQQQFHIRPHLQLHTGLTLTGKLHRGKEKRLPINPPPMSTLLDLILTMCSCHSVTPNLLWWLINDTTLPLSFFEHIKSQSTTCLCPFNMHDKTAWLQPYSKTFIQKTFKRTFSQRSRLHKKKKIHLWIFKEAGTRTTRMDMGMLKCL